ncbi:transcription-repair coupling factor [Agathobaculum sp. NTUH-O15-33]|uniref:transcription-repair coupling factor n=1 Tax=Agathobaculum sp. NTUH-O15-33 TaxID=3079302 RepID=UPI0029588F9D|nr:transcription-repair coupling factor [Agathobaculum sp. NTUH-O15-33]WNX84646.1 transcription-repair coupling factor [Agathobaculum sp. NTUH-O15-33]
MIEITKSISALAEYREVRAAIKAGQTPVLAVGLSPIHKAHIAAALQLDLNRPVAVLTADESGATRMAADIAGFAERDVLTVSYRDLVMVNVAGVSRGYEQKRIAALCRLADAPLSVLSAPAALQRTLPPDILRRATLTLEAGQTAPLEGLTARLTEAGYERCIQVEGTGQFSVRGGILDVFPANAEHPFRVEFWDDEIDSISTFDVGSQRRLDNVSSLTCLPRMETLVHLAPGGANGLADAIEQLLKTRRKKHPDLAAHIARDAERLRETGSLPSADKYLPLIYPEMTTALDYLPENAVLLIEDTPRLHEAARDFDARVGDDITALLERGEMPPDPGDFTLDFAGLCRLRRPIVRLDSFLNTVPELAPAVLQNFTASQMNAYGGNLDLAAADIAGFIQQGKAVAVVCGSELRCKNMLDALSGAGVKAALSDLLPKPKQVAILEGTLSAGFEYPETGLVVMTEGQVLARRKKVAPRRGGRDRVKSYTDLTPGDLVVHEHHGIGRFVGMERMEVDGADRDFIKIAFAGTDFLYVPATSLDLISKYIGGGDSERTRLNKLGGADWSRAKARAKAAAKELAEGLIQLYAARAKLKGFSFPPDDEWQREFEDAFPYEETEDQLRCIAEIKSDMESDRPMDRLLCGDVGFGKTEVALRAVMKCILAGKQAAILVPTTVLARQHFLTALQRFQGHPITIELLTRYKTTSEQKKILQKLEAGSIDLVIGTHKLFRKDLKFKDLGLLVVDEEQRFGVSHKETLKEMSKQVDVLTLSATPIPRTLNMALSGIRDMSAIEEPPLNRHPVQTFVLEQNEGVLLDAMRRELSRGGQVYYLHNHVESIARCALRLKQHLPDAEVGIVHGKMTQKEIASAMNAMADGETDILVCTTIIETGIDIPNANTLIIENADAMGLAQLHQIRGRVGRSSRHAYAYLTYRRGKALSEIAQKRLSAIREYAAFGSGFKIAMRDLEIRGAGNVLGPEQSGHMMSVGYDLYLKLLEEAVTEEKGETPRARVDCAAELLLSANLPADYVPDAGQRVDLYRRIALIRTEEQKSDMLDEMIDRFGEPPEQAVALLDIALLRAKASEQGISEIKQADGRLLMTFADADFRRLSALCGDKTYRGRLLLNAGSTPYVSLRLEKGEVPIEMAGELVERYAETVEKAVSIHT